MALFFDQEWFNARLAAVGATREDIGRLLRLNADQISEIWKDQRELTAQDVVQLARFLNVMPAEIALKAGVSTPVPDAEMGLYARLDHVESRMNRIESLLLEIKEMVASLRR